MTETAQRPVQPPEPSPEARAEIKRLMPLWRAETDPEKKAALGRQIGALAHGKELLATG